MSRTSSNILLNSVHLSNQSNQLHPHSQNHHHHHHNHHHNNHSHHNHHHNSNLRASDCDLGITINDIQLQQHQDAHSELSDLDVSTINCFLCYLKSIMPVNQMRGEDNSSFVTHLCAEGSLAKQKEENKWHKLL